MARSRKTDPRIWERTYLLNRAMIDALRAQVGRHFPLGWQGRVLDVGCGGKPYESLFEGRCAEYLGCDPYPSDDATVACPADALAFEDDSFDAVVTFQVLEHIPRPWAAVAECARVLKPGGFLLATAPFVFPHHASPHDFYRYTHEGLAQLALEAGLEAEEITAQVPSLATLCLLWNWYNGMVHDKVRHIHPKLPALVTAFAIVPTNLLGRAAGQLPLGRDFRKGNLGFSNYLMIARKPG